MMVDSTDYSLAEMKVVMKVELLVEQLETY